MFLFLKLVAFSTPKSITNFFNDDDDDDFETSISTFETKIQDESSKVVESKNGFSRNNSIISIVSFK